MVDWRPVIDIVKILGKTVIDVIDIGDYRITLIVERKIDDKVGVVVESISVDKRMSSLEAETITRRIRAVIEKK